MRRLLSVLFIVFSSLILFGCGHPDGIHTGTEIEPEPPDLGETDTLISDLPELPDLVVTSLEVLTNPSNDELLITFSEDNTTVVIIRVVIKNQGDAPAGIFDVGTEFTGGNLSPDEISLIGFTHIPSVNFWFPHTSAPLGAGDEIRFDGNVIFSASHYGQTVSLVAIADVCNVEFLPVYCRVRESNEGNNRSASLSLLLTRP